MSFSLSCRSRVFILLVFVAVLSLVAVLPAAATNCNVSHGNCDASVNLIEFTGTPTVICLIGHPVVQITVNVSCSGNNAGPFSTKKCGIQSDKFEFTALGYVHTFKPKDGFNWEDVYNGNCDALDYKRIPQ